MTRPPNRLARRRARQLAARLEPGSEAAAPGSSRTTAVLLPGASIGGPDRLEGAVLEVLLEVERRGLHTVLLAADAPDLHTPVAAVTRYVVAADGEILVEARAIWGAERVREASGLTDAELAGPLATLPVPASRSWQRQLQRLLQGRSLGRLAARASALRTAPARIRQNRAERRRRDG